MFEGYGESGNVCGTWGRVVMFVGYGGEMGESGNVCGMWGRVVMFMGFGIYLDIK